MSLEALILTLISEIDDAAIRSDIAATITYLSELYATGRISENELKDELKEVVRTVIEAVNPHLLPEEVAEKTEDLTAQLIRQIKLKTLRVRISGFRRIRRGEVPPAELF